jgi:tetratricopeptide (TPR) repeat protein
VTSKDLVLVLALLVPAAAACRPKDPPTEPDAPKAEPKAAVDAPPGLQEIADAIDPGPRAALTVDVPPWLSAALQLPGSGGDPQVLLAAARDEWEAFQTPAVGGGDAAQLEKVVRLARALALAERAGGNVETAPVEVLLVLERIYQLLDAPALANDRNLFGRMIQGFVGMLAQQGQQEGSASLDELAGLVFGVLQKSGELHRRTVAALLRKAPGHPEIPNVLGRLGPKLMVEDEVLAVGVLRRSLALRGKEATAAHWLELAGLCSRALDVDCSGKALAQAHALAKADDAKQQQELVSARAQLEHARRAVELEGAAGLEDGLELGTVLVELQRYKEARAVYEALIRRHPDDARPVLGMARVVLVDGFDFVAASEVIERAQPREHLDRDWYELTIGVRATALIYHVLPQIADRGPDEIFEMLRPMLLQMKQDIDALEALGADEGRVLRFVYELGMEAWPKLRAAGDGEAFRVLLRELLPRVEALRAEVPGSLHAYSLVLAGAVFSNERARALAVLELAPPAEHAGALAVRRAHAAFDLVASWDAVDRVGVMLELVDAVAASPQPLAARRLAVDGHVLARRLGKGSEGWTELEQRYRVLQGEPGGESDAVLLNNLAVTVAEQGRTDEAQALWAQARERAPEEARDVPRLNALVARLVAAGKGKDAAATADRAELVTLAESGGAVEVRLQAHAWLVALAASGAERRKAAAALRAVAAKEAATNYRPRNLPGKSAVIMRGTFQVGLGYSTVEGLQIQFDTSGVPWQVMPCPVAVPDPRAKPQP